MNAPEDRSKALNEHMSSGFAPRADIVAACWHVRFVPIVLQKSPSGLYEVEICNYRIGAPVLLNRCCAFQPDLESIFLAEMLKILLQHNLPTADMLHPSFGAAGNVRALRLPGGPDLRRAHRLGHAEEDHDALSAASGRERLGRRRIAAIDV